MHSKIRVSLKQFAHGKKRDRLRNIFKKNWHVILDQKKIEPLKFEREKNKNEYERKM